MAKAYDRQLIEKYPSISDMQKLATKRIPFLSREYLEAGTGDEFALSRNREGFQDVVITPGILKGEIDPDLTTELLGIKYNAPFGIAPVGLTGLIWPGAEFFLAKTASKYKIPHCLSTVATQTPESIGPLVGDMGWFQLYPPKEEAIWKDLLDRAATAGFHTLVVTADVPIPSRRERTKRAGLRMPPKTTLKMVWDTLMHPHWLKGVMKYGSPSLKTIEKYTEDKSRAAVAQYVNDNLGGTLSWEYLSELKKYWNGDIILKGVLDRENAQRAVDAGVGGIVVSNHGGRQFDAAPAPIQVLPDIVEAVGQQTAVMFDSGVTNGMDVIKALHLGADFVFLGRAFLYGLAALGEHGATHVCEILIDELKNNMMQMGVGSIKEIRR